MFDFTRCFSIFFLCLFHLINQFGCDFLFLFERKAWLKARKDARGSSPVDNS